MSPILAALLCFAAGLLGGAAGVALAVYALLRPQVRQMALSVRAKKILRQESLPDRNITESTAEEKVKGTRVKRAKMRR